MSILKPLVPLTLALIFAGAARAEDLAVRLDHTTRLNVRGAATVVIGNSGVADVTIVDSHTVYVSGRAYGSTDIIISDRNGRSLFSGDVTVVRPASSVALYRGAERSDFACAPDCAKTVPVAPTATASQALPAVQATSEPTPGAAAAR